MQRFTIEEMKERFESKAGFFTTGDRNKKEFANWQEGIGTRSHEELAELYGSLDSKIARRRMLIAVENTQDDDMLIDFMRHAMLRPMAVEWREELFNEVWTSLQGERDQLDTDHKALREEQKVCDDIRKAAAQVSLDYDILASKYEWEQKENRRLQDQVARLQRETATMRPDACNWQLMQGLLKQLMPQPEPEPEPLSARDQALIKNGAWIQEFLGYVADGMNNDETDIDGAKGILSEINNE